MKEKLVSICTPRQWKTLSKSELKDEGYTVYGANGVIGYYNEYNHEVETVMVTCRGATCGTVNISKPYSYINGNAMCMDDLRHDIDVKYLYYALKHYDFREVISGSAQPQITRQSLNNVFIEVVGQNKQLEIVKILSNIEESIITKQRLLYEYDQLIKSRFVEMFGENGREVPLTDYVWFQEGPGVRSVDFKNDGCILLTGSNINDNKITFGYNSDRFISDVLAKGKYSHFICDKNDILVVTSAIAPDKFDSKVVVVDTDDRYCLNTGIIRFKPNKEYLTIGYFREFLKSMYFKSQVMNEMTGIAQMHFGPSHLKKMNILLPEDLIVQKEFDSFLEQVDKLKFVVQQSLDETQKLFDSLMQKYFG